MATTVRAHWPCQVEDLVGEGAGGLPRLQLDELLAELQVRIDAVRGTHDRVHNLLEAVVAARTSMVAVSGSRR